jgi:hypothetical protein
MMTVGKWVLLGLLVSGMAVPVGSALGQAVEQEPNNTCLSAQQLGSPGTLPADVSGSLDPEGGVVPPPSDVDFFSLNLTPGQRISVDLLGSPSGAGDLPDPYLGFFDSSCTLLAANDDSSLGLESRLDIETPADGVVILAATGCCDSDFSGGHGYAGSYVMVIQEPQPPIGSIRGRVVEAGSGLPLSGNEAPFPVVELTACGQAGCGQLMASASPDENGEFVFTTNFEGYPLAAGEYLVYVHALDYAYDPAQAGPFPVGVGEDYDLGDLFLEPPPFAFGPAVPCADLGPAGGVCRYSVEVSNHTGDALLGIAWSNVQGYATGSPVGYSWFTARREQIVRVRAGGTAKLNFSFTVPAGVADGAFFCTDVWLSDRQHAFLGTVQTQSLFCVSKQAGQYRMLAPKPGNKNPGQHGRRSAPHAGG